ncbi:kinase-like domain-containing protein [Nemania diffusa]|nr:kinase-like domain-containing protein [Nemania diffusa]
MDELSRKITDDDIFPIGDMREIWTASEIRSIIANIALNDDQVKFVQDNLLRTISLLVRIGVEDFGQKIFQWIQSNQKFDERLHELDCSELVQNLARHQRNHFNDIRKSFNAIIITEGEDMNLERGQSLPLNRIQEIGTGMNGSVTGHEIPRGHLVRQGEACLLSLSLYKTLGIKTSEKEVVILKYLRELLLNEDIPLYTCFSMLNLDELLERINGYGETDKTRVSSSISQIKGITEAINFLHTSSPPGRQPDDGINCFCHMDVKPPNILVFLSSDSASTVGQWKLIDFGVSTVSIKRDRDTIGGPREDGHNRVTMTVGTNGKVINGTHQAPEVHMGPESRDVGRGSDVWSLGCMFSEVLAANDGGLVTLHDEMLKHSEFFYEKINDCWKRVFYWKGFRRNPAFEKWLTKDLPKMNLPDMCQGIIMDMTEVKRIERPTSRTLVGRMQLLEQKMTEGD